MAIPSAFNTIVSTGEVVEQISFAFPAALLLWQRRDARFLPQSSRYNLGTAGWLVNSVVVAWTCLVLVIYSLPTVKPVTAHNMSEYIIGSYHFRILEGKTTNLWSLDLSDYACVVLVGMGLVTMMNWSLYARKYYHGPSMTLIIGN